MQKNISRRNVLVSGAAAGVIVTASSVSALANCSHDHIKMSYALGAQWVDPAIDDVGRQLVAASKCPGCGTKIEPAGLSYGEHMRG